jgi:hypothetical protein
MVIAAFIIPMAFVKPPSEERVHILFIEGEMMDKK